MEGGRDRWREGGREGYGGLGREGETAGGTDRREVEREGGRQVGRV